MSKPEQYLFWPELYGRQWWSEVIARAELREKAAHELDKQRRIDREAADDVRHQKQSEAA